MKRANNVAKTNGKTPPVQRVFLRPHPGDTPGQFADRLYAELQELIHRDKAMAPEE
jgi:hypothetical protein